MKKILLISLSFPFLLMANDTHAQKLAKGKAIYQETCISCHGSDGETNKEMKLVVTPRKLSKTILNKEESFKVIKEGAKHWGSRSDIMPSFKSIYTDKQIESIVEYISFTFNPNRDKRVAELLAKSDKITKGDEAKMLKKGHKIFKRNCSMCHGITGNGESEYVEQSKSSDIFIYPYNLTKTLLSEDEIFLYAKHGGHYWGTGKTDMPSWKKKYDDFTLRSVAKYVQEKIKNPNN